MSVDAFYEGAIYIVTSLKSVDAFFKKQFLIITDKTHFFKTHLFTTGKMFMGTF